MKIILLLLLCALNIQAANFDQYCEALAKVESSNNPRAYNANENAIGLYQIRAAYFKDAQAFDPDLKGYSHKDCFTPAVGKRVVWAYAARYEPSALRKMDVEVLAKLHNGGVKWQDKDGRAKKNLEIYWAKVRKYLTGR